MMKRRLWILAILLVSAIGARAQEKFIFEGSIDYERKINMHRQIPDDAMDNFFKDFIATTPAFHNSMFTLQFKSNRSLYKPAGELPATKVPWLMGPAKENIVLYDEEKRERQTIKTVFEKRFLVLDSVAPIRWRMTGEKRDIAGFECRKAVTVICDSVYVVAFFAEEIPVSSGPESFGGLPGMILGLAVPRLHTTWFATRVTLSAPPSIALEVKGRIEKTNTAKLQTTLKSFMDDWGKYAAKNTWWVML